jgi:hypothetical protein
MAACPRPVACSTAAARRSSRQWRRPPAGSARRGRAALPIQTRRQPLRGMRRLRCQAVRSWRRRRRVPAPAPRARRSSRPASAGPLSPRRPPPHPLALHRLTLRHRLVLRRLGIRPRRLRLPRRPTRPRRPRPPRRRAPGVRRRYGGRCVRIRGRRPRRPHSVPRRQAPARVGQALRLPGQAHARLARVRVLVQARLVARASPPRARRPPSAALRPG